MSGILQTKAMGGIKGPPEAAATLARLVKWTAPLVSRRGWRINVLKEFYPQNGGLLGMNVNRTTILVRLRCADNTAQFLPWNDVLGTLVHELTHMEVGAHSFEFYTLLDIL
jgi:DNA-dependent metalloprotease WSS1